jgi:hypothetical protein
LSTHRDMILERSPRGSQSINLEDQSQIQLPSFGYVNESEWRGSTTNEKKSEKFYNDGMSNLDIVGTQGHSPMEDYDCLRDIPSLHANYKRQKTESNSPIYQGEFHSNSNP